MLTKKDLKRRFNIGQNTVYRTLQACPLSTKKKNYTESEIEQYFVPARQMLAAGKTYKEVEQFFALKPSEQADFLEAEEINTSPSLVKNTEDVVNQAIPIEPSEQADVLKVEEVKASPSLVKDTENVVNQAIPIEPLDMDNDSNYDNSSKRFRITYSTSQASARLAKVSNRECITSYSQMTSSIQTIHKLGGTILLVTQVA